MKFIVFSFHEKYHKLFAFISVLVITISSLIYYSNLQEKNDGFYISIIYAVFLFIVGLYLNSWEKRIQDQFFARKEQYVTFNKLRSLFSSEINEITKISSDNEARKFILSDRVFTGRIENKDLSPYIVQNGFKYTESFLKLEQRCISSIESVCEELNYDITQYLENNKIQKKMYFHISSIDEFGTEIEDWCKEKFNLTGSQLNNIMNYIYNLFETKAEKIDKIRNDINRLNKKYLSYRKIINDTMDKLEKIYGIKLREVVSFETNIYHNFNALESLINSVKEDIVEVQIIDELKELILDNTNALRIIDEKINELSNGLSH